MPEIHFANLDLNLLRVFDALAEEASATRAGARLGLTQSAVSHALGRLRRVFDDELFVRGPSGMQATPRALEIAPRVRQGLNQLQAALAPATFSPSDTQRRFVIATGSYICTTLIPVLADLIRREAPNVNLRVRQIGPSIGDELLTGRADVAIGGFGAISSRLRRATLLHERSAWALRAGHPAVRSGRLTLETLARLPHVFLAYGEEDQAVDGRVTDGGVERRVIWDEGKQFEQVLSERGWPRRQGLAIHDPIGALAIAGRTDMATLTLRRLASAFADRFGLVLFDPPYEAPPSPIEMLWRRERPEEAPVAWLIERITAAAREISASGDAADNWTPKPALEANR